MSWRNFWLGLPFSRAGLLSSDVMLAFDYIVTNPEQFGVNLENIKSGLAWLWGRALDKMILMRLCPFPQCTHRPYSHVYPVAFHDVLRSTASRVRCSRALKNHLAGLRGERLACESPHLQGVSDNQVLCWQTRLPGRFSPRKRICGAELSKILLWRYALTITFCGPHNG